MATCPIPDKHLHVGLPIKDVFDHILVRCPRCAACATIVKRGKRELPPYLRSVRLMCSGCGKIQEHEQPGFAIRRRVDTYLRLPLWLQRPCRRNTLWAYNLHHLAFLEVY